MLPSHTASFALFMLSFSLLFFSPRRAIGFSPPVFRGPSTYLVRQQTRLFSTPPLTATPPVGVVQDAAFSALCSLSISSNVPLDLLGRTVDLSSPYKHKGSTPLTISGGTIKVRVRERERDRS